MDVSGSTATIIAAMSAVLIAFVGFVASVHYRLGRLDMGHNGLKEGQERLEEGLGRRMDSLEKGQEGLGRRMDSLEKGQEGLERRMDALERGQADLRTELADLREQVSADNTQLRELIRSEGERTRAELGRLADALVSHYHDSDGTTVFRIPPPAS